MEVQVTLNIVTLIMCVITLSMATAALMPQIRQGMIILRDTLLWLFLIAVVVTVSATGWSRVYETHGRRLWNWGELSDPQRQRETDLVQRRPTPAPSGSGSSAPRMQERIAPNRSIAINR